MCAPSVHRRFRRSFKDEAVKMTREVHHKVSERFVTGNRRLNHAVALFSEAQCNAQLTHAGARTTPTCDDQLRMTPGRDLRKDVIDCSFPALMVRLAKVGPE